MDSDSDVFRRIEEANLEIFGSGTQTPFDPMQHARLSPGAFDPTGFSSNFILPRFASGGPAGAFGFGPAIVEPELERPMLKSAFSNFAAIPRPFPSPASQYNPLPSPSEFSTLIQQSNPIYTPYGSSVVGVNPSLGSTSKLSPPSKNSLLPSKQLPTLPQSNIYNPEALGLPVPPAAGTSTNFAGLYSSSGFDVLSVLARVAARPNPSINIGPVDTSCAFLVVDARRYDYPIVFASETFSKLTGYTCEEIIGRNCRFLQSPDGITTQGSPRRYTDGNAAWHMRTHITSGKESQSSLINYRKGGKPFINLVTIVPIQWDTPEIAYYIGFQVDLVDQPNAILDRMKDGTYVVNYSLLNNPAKALSIGKSEVEAAMEEEVWSGPVEDLTKPAINTIEPSYALMEPLMEEDAEASESLLLSTVQSAGVYGLETDEMRKQFNKLLLDNSDDFIHVLSLKGSLLYCSPSAERMLEYSPSELVGKTLPSLCHPSDVIPVMRELKDSGNVSHPVVSLLYRIRRKNSGYIWIEATGKLYVEPGKGRKCVILVGRPREVYKMSWAELRVVGGLGDTEFWTKLSPEGMVLSCGVAVQNVLGFLPEEMVGTSLFQLIKPEKAAELLSALRECSAGAAVSVRYHIKSRRGFVEVLTRLFPRTAIAIDGDGMDTDMNDNRPRHLSIIAQTNEITSEQRKATTAFRGFAPAYRATANSHGGMSESGSGIGDGSLVLSTFKTLNHPSSVSDNMFDELDTTRCTSWQYELHQLQNINKKLRDEKDYLLSRARKRKADFDALQVGKKSGRGSSNGSSKSKKKDMSCANCGRTDSPEWRAGPTGTKSLCNACGLRWAKGQRSSSAGSGSGTSSTGRGRKASVAIAPVVAAPPAPAPFVEAIPVFAYSPTDSMLSPMMEESISPGAQLWR